ncbi:MAG: hypothetical protein QNI96_08985 [Woeseiaceae bacterium]|nr:hypothetical protein [Woeseiaceae bacterium]
MRAKLHLFLILSGLSGLLLAGCAGNSSVNAPDQQDAAFNNVLVIAVTGDYNTRSHFERVVVSNIRKTGTSAAPWHSVIGGDKAVTKEDVIAAIDSQGFDSVLAIRRLDGDVQLKVKKSRTEIDATPIGGRFVNLFRSDYTDYKKPGSVEFITNALLAVEFYGAGSEEIVFAFDHQTGKQSNIGLLIDQTAETIVKRIERQGLLAD